MSGWDDLHGRWRITILRENERIGIEFDGLVLRAWAIPARNRLDFRRALDEVVRPLVGVQVVRCQWSGVSEWRVICPRVGVELCRAKRLGNER